MIIGTGNFLRTLARNITVEVIVNIVKHDRWETNYCDCTVHD